MPYKTLKSYRKEFLSAFDRAGGVNRLKNMMCETDEETGKHTEVANERFIDMFHKIISLMPKDVTVAHEVEGGLMLNLIVPRPQLEGDRVEVVEALEVKENKQIDTASDNKDYVNSNDDNDLCTASEQPVDKQGGDNQTDVDLTQEKEGSSDEN